MKFLKVYMVVTTVIVPVFAVIDRACTLSSSGASGTCKLLIDCQPARDEIIKHDRIPQTCGFQNTQAIVCCPNSAGRRRKPGTISRSKCREYSANAYSLKTQPTKNECGHRIVKRIVGGKFATRKEFAHMAILGFDLNGSEIYWACGGTIISERYILTAAHCIFEKSRGNIKFVKVGVTNLTDTNHRQQFEIAKLIPHPLYTITSHYNDIGLIKLNKPIKLNPYARPACLYTDSDISIEKAIATGWGYTSFASGLLSSELMKVTLDIVGYDFCNMSYKSNFGKKLEYGILRKSQLCAGSGGEEKDTCQGDAGGPLQIYHESDDVSCMYDVIGVTSFGMYCGSGPGVYTKVSNYIEWIEDIVWPESS